MKTGGRMRKIAVLTRLHESKSSHRLDQLQLTNKGVNMLTHLEIQQLRHARSRRNRRTVYMTILIVIMIGLMVLDFAI